MVNPGAFRGSRKDFLMSQKAAYAEAVVGGFSSDALANIQRRYFKRYPVDLPHEEEPSPEALAAVDDDAPDPEPDEPDREKMTEEEYQEALEAMETRMGIFRFRRAVSHTVYFLRRQRLGSPAMSNPQQIKRWMAYQYMKDQDACSSDSSTSNSLANVMSQLTGKDGGKPRKKTAVNVWRKSQRQVIDLKVKSIADAQGIPKDRMAALRDKVAREMFNALPAAVQAKWKEQALKESELANEEWERSQKEEPSEKPEDRQVSIQGLVRVSQPFIDALAKRTGWNVTLIAGGPEPAHDGQLNIISVHSGLTLGDVKMNFGRSERSDYKKYIVPIYGKFLKKCFTPEECRARALKQDDGFVPLSEDDIENSGGNMDVINLNDSAERVEPDNDGAWHQEPTTSSEQSPDCPPPVADGSAPLDTRPSSLRSDPSTHGEATSSSTAGGGGDDPPVPAPAASPRTCALAEAAACDDDLSQAFMSPRNSPPLPLTQLVPSPVHPTTSCRSTLETPRFFVEPNSRLPTPPRQPSPSPESHPSREQPPPSPQVSGSPMANARCSSQPLSPRTTPPPSPQRSFSNSATSTLAFSIVSAGLGEPSSSSTPPMPGTHAAKSIPCSPEPDVRAPSMSREPSVCPRLPSTRSDNAAPPSGQDPESEASAKSSTKRRHSTSSTSSSSPSPKRIRTEHGAVDAVLSTSPPPSYDIIPSPPNAPKWFEDGFVMLQCRNLGPQWSALLENWLCFELQGRFKERGKLGARHRPSCIGDWIQRRRATTWRPVIEIPAFEEKFIKWWASVQPEWRISNAGDIDVSAAGSDWEDLYKPGLNGIYSIIVALFYWGLAVKAGSGEHSRWLNAVKDVDFALTNLLGDEVRSAG
ncbi:hypothetical protein CVT26_013679 [Gymnopilus dilepis]|uniref:Uncharacterized protein n=1 Tax=Gymnopilus dilepis TaxID=231916 RepID=A0A409YWF3_9AGAR|nr:hypothetical protein CVT26_013679 [Gymnopilus dilepis]